MKIMSIVLVLSFGFTTASKKLNQFKLDQTTYQTNHGYIENYGPDQSGTSINYDVHLISVPKEEMSENINYILIDINSNKDGMISSGKYVFDNENDELKSFTFNSASVLIDYNTDDHSGQVYFAVDGNVDIKKKKNSYAMTYNFTLENGKKVNGTFEGPLELW